MIKQFDILVITPREPKYLGSRLYRSCLVQKVKGDSCIDERELFFEFEGMTDPSIDLSSDDADDWLRILTMDAMMHNASIYINGKVSRRCLENMREFQRLWNVWLKLPIVNIQVKSFRDECYPNLNIAASSFTGGVDSLFSVLSTRQELLHGMTEHSLKYAVYAHGFDFELADEEKSLSRMGQVRRMAVELGVELVELRTNIRDICHMNWGWLHGIAIVAGVSQIRPLIDTCLVPSTYTYEYPQLQPWGSHPLSDVLGSSKDLRVIHHGASFSRQQKLLVISKLAPALLQNVMVCHHPPSDGGNCGQCEKCLRTRTAMEILQLEERFQLFHNSPALDDCAEIVVNHIRGRSLRKNQWKKLLADASSLGERCQPISRSIKRILDLAENQSPDTVGSA